MSLFEDTTNNLEIVTSALTPLPTSEQQALMDQNFTMVDVVDSGSVATVGMFGQDGKYYFYMEFQPADDWYSLPLSPLTFRILFQMGESSSEWAGVRMYFDSNGPYSNKLYALEPSSVQNSNLAQIATNENDNSTFQGEFDTTNNVVKILRVIEMDEQTLDDGSITRIENGRNLKARYWTSDGTQKEFQIELQGAINSVVCLTGIALAATASLLAF